MDSRRGIQSCGDPMIRAAGTVHAILVHQREGTTAGQSRRLRERRSRGDGVRVLSGKAAGASGWRGGVSLGKKKSKGEGCGGPCFEEDNRINQGLEVSTDERAQRANGTFFSQSLASKKELRGPHVVVADYALI